MNVKRIAFVCFFILIALVVKFSFEWLTFTTNIGRYISTNVELTSVSFEDDEWSVYWDVSDLKPEDAGVIYATNGCAEDRLLSLLDYHDLVNGEYIWTGELNIKSQGVWRAARGLKLHVYDGDICLDVNDCDWIDVVQGGKLIGSDSISISKPGIFDPC